MMRVVSGSIIFLHALLWLWLVSHDSSTQDKIALLLGFGNFELGWLTVPRGRTVDTGLMWLENKKVTPFEKITKIRGYFTYGLPFNKVFHCVMTYIYSSSGTRRKMFLTKRDLTQLYGTPLNKWVIGHDTFEFMAEGSSGEMHVEYKPRGKYSPGWPLLIVYNFVIALASLAFLTRLASLPTLLFCLVLIFGVILGARSYKKVSVSLTTEGMCILENGAERFLPMNEISTIDSQGLRIKVTKSGGEEFYLPKGCYFLAEIIEEELGCKNSSANLPFSKLSI